MVEPDCYCKVSGMALEAIYRLNQEGHRKPVVIEIGTADGIGTRRIAGFCSKLIGIDAMVNGRPDIVSDQKQDMQLDQAKIDEFKLNTRNLPVDLIIGCSCWPDVVERVTDLVWGATADGADLLIVDGCHHPFEAVWKDFELYSPLVRPGGYVIFDDLYEECIEQAHQKAISQGYVQVDRWGVKTPHILQEVGLLKKPG